MRLIDVDKFEEKNAKVWEQLGKEDCYYSVGYILSQASVDAVPVIRCKDCKHRPIELGKGEAGFKYDFPAYSRCPCQCDDGWYNWRPDDDWYCANAERREE